MGHAVSQVNEGEQLALHDGWTAALGHRPAAPSSRRSKETSGETSAETPWETLCAGCREKEARYGFRHDDEDPALDRPRTLCFSCFRAELTRRQAVKARLARGWNGQQVSLPLEETLTQLTKRRRRAQIAARHALGL
jgi:hypothetical protein